MQHLKLKSSICLRNYLFLSANHKTATKLLKRGILEECLLSFLASNRITSGIMYCPSVRCAMGCCSPRRDLFLDNDLRTIHYPLHNYHLVIDSPDNLKEHYATIPHFFRVCFNIDTGNYFWYLQIHFDGISSCEGQINTRIFPIQDCNM